MTSRAPEQLYRVHWLSESGGTGSTALDKDGTVQPAGVSKEEAERWANYWNRVTRIGTKYWIEAVEQEPPEVKP